MHMAIQASALRGSRLFSSAWPAPMVVNREPTTNTRTPAIISNSLINTLRLYHLRLLSADLRQFIDSCTRYQARVRLAAEAHGVAGLEQTLASLNSKGVRPKAVWATSHVMFLLLLFSSNALSTRLSTSSASIDLEFERSKLQRYEQRIDRLEITIQNLRSQLELLAAERDSLEVRVLSLKKSLRLVHEKYASIALYLEHGDSIDVDARQRHADFEIYLAERKYNRALRELNETQNHMSRTTDYLQDRIDLLKRNRQGLVWQKQVLKKYRTSPSLEPIRRHPTERLAQAQ